ncbi:putative cysteine methyltransferase [Cystovirus CAP3]|nr:putative cysteine methyltransferase [Cystovirus CAP3]
MKHGVINIDEAGTPTLVEKNGISGVLAGVTTIFSPAEGVVGIPKVTSHVVSALAGNLLATHSTTGRLGVSALGKTISFG